MKKLILFITICILTISDLFAQIDWAPYPGNPVIDENFDPSTPNISLLYAMDYKLKQMLEEGAENIYKRHKEMAEYTRNWALEKGFGLFAEEGYRSVTVTTVANTLEKDVGELNKALAEKGLVIANGYGKLANLTFRIGHMGDHTMDDLKELLAAIDEIWNL